jgi:hypothetical protein
MTDLHYRAADGLNSTPVSFAAPLPVTPAVGGAALSPINPLPVTPAVAALTDRSGSIASGGNAQTLAAANAGRKGYWIQNNSSGDLWLSTEAAAVAGQPSLRLRAGALYEPPVVSTGAISVIGANTGQAFSAREW